MNKTVKIIIGILLILLGICLKSVTDMSLRLVSFFILSLPIVLTYIFFITKGYKLIENKSKTDNFFIFSIFYFINFLIQLGITFIGYKIYDYLDRNIFIGDYFKILLLNFIIFKYLISFTLSYFLTIYLTERKNKEINRKEIFKKFLIIDSIFIFVSFISSILFAIIWVYIQKIIVTISLNNEFFRNFLHSIEKKLSIILAFRYIYGILSIFLNITSNIIIISIILYLYSLISKNINLRKITTSYLKYSIIFFFFIILSIILLNYFFEPKSQNIIEVKNIGDIFDL